MGGCLSCLGAARRSELEDEESSHLLHQDAPATSYGAIEANPPGAVPEVDSAELRREREAMERLCTQTTDKLIDVVSVNSEEYPKTTNDYPKLFNERFDMSEISAMTYPYAGLSPDGNEPYDEADDHDDSWSRVQVAGKSKIIVDFGLVENLASPIQSP